MIFNENSREILAEWIKDFEAAPMDPGDANLIPALKTARLGLDCKLMYVCSIAGLAVGNINTAITPQDMFDESMWLIKDISTHYDTDQMSEFSVLIKKRN